MFTVFLAYVVVFFLLVSWLRIYVEVDVDRITIFPPPSLFFSFPTILSLRRLKLVSVPFSSLVLYIGHLEKSFPESIM